MDKSVGQRPSQGSYQSSKLRWIKPMCLETPLISSGKNAKFQDAQYNAGFEAKSHTRCKHS